MNTRTLLTLPLLATLALPLVAQQQTLAVQQQPIPAPPQVMAAPAPQNEATTQQTQSSTEATDANRYQPTTGEKQLEPLKQSPREGFWGRMNPFARKKYVEKQVAPIRERANELDELTATNARNLKDVDARATAGIQRADRRAMLADQHAVEAGNRAQMAHQTAQQANTQLTTVSQVVENLDQYQSASQVEIRFKAGSTTLSKNAQEALDQIAATMKDQKGYLVEIQGFAPGKGTASIQHSQKLTDAVERYFVINHQIPVYRIYQLGLGSAQMQTAAQTSESRASSRVARVEVTLLKNSLGSLQASQQPPAMSNQPQQ